MMMTLTRHQVLRHGVQVQQLNRPTVSAGDAAILDLGVQHTGPDGALWAFANRGMRARWEDLVILCTLRGAPHAYRRGEVGQVTAAVAPLSGDDAGRRIFDASKPLRRAGIDPADALRIVGAAMRDQSTAPGDKGE